MLQPQVFVSWHRCWDGEQLQPAPQVQTEVTVPAPPHFPRLRKSWTRLVGILDFSDPRTPPPPRHLLAPLLKYIPYLSSSTSLHSYPTKAQTSQGQELCVKTSGAWCGSRGKQTLLLNQESLSKDTSSLFRAKPPEVASTLSCFCFLQLKQNKSSLSCHTAPNIRR